MVSTPKAPEPADPKETAAAQNSTSIAGSVANQAGALIDQYNPWGSLQYRQKTNPDGTPAPYIYHDPLNDEEFEIPQWEAIQTLTPEGQAIQDQTLDTQLNLATLASDQSGRLNNLLSEPIDMSNESIDGHFNDMWDHRLAGTWNDREDALNTRLSNQGVEMGSDAWHDAMGQFSKDRTDAYNQAYLGARGMALNEMYAERNQPINEITALLSGSQVNQPSFSAQPGLNMPITDFAGIQAQYDNQKSANWQAQQASGGFPFGGLFSLIGAL